MGYALITSDDGDGRYTIQLDWGETLRMGYVNAATALVASLTQRIAAQQVVVDAADANEAAIRADLTEVFDAIAEQMQASPGGYSQAAQSLFESLLGQLRKAEASSAPARIALRQLTAQLVTARKRLFTWENLVCLVSRQAWCADYTEGASGYVATLDIPGESDLILIAPGARVPVTAQDGYMQARELMSPEQAYFNVAILPGWQIDLPTYRWGTLTRIDWDTNVGNVTLASALSSAQRLDVNRESALTGIPFSYMGSDCRAFNDDSKVIVDLREGWAAPRIIGFLDNPRPDPPKIAAITAFQRTFTQDKPDSADYSAEWTGGAAPRTYTLLEGSLPAGISLDQSTGVISGTPTTGPSVSSGIVIRCSDTFYDEAKNRRYDDSPPFEIGVLGGWEFFSGALDSAEHASRAGTIYVELVSSGVVTDELQARTSKFTQGIGDEFLDSFSWAKGWDLFGFPNIWRRLDVIGDAPNDTSSATGTWLSSGGVWRWRIESGSVGTVMEATYTLRYATDSSGDKVVSSVTGRVTVEYPPL